jgi:hypothetical protein
MLVVYNRTSNIPDTIKCRHRVVTRQSAAGARIQRVTAAPARRLTPNHYEPHKLIVGCSSETSSFLMLFTRSPTATIVKPAANGASNLFAVAPGAVSQR